MNYFQLNNQLVSVSSNQRFTFKWSCDTPLTKKGSEFAKHYLL
jgi:hypothetical protein